MKRLTYKPTLVNDPNRKLRCLDGELMCWIGHALQGNPRPNLYSGRLRLAPLSIKWRGVRTTTTHLLRARTPATAPGPLALPTWSILPERPAPVYTGMRAPEDSDARKTRYIMIFIRCVHVPSIERFSKAWASEHRQTWISRSSSSGTASEKVRLETNK